MSWLLELGRLVGCLCSFLFSFGPYVFHCPRTSENEVRTLPSAAPSVPWLVTGAKLVTTTSAKVSLESSTAAEAGEAMNLTSRQQRPEESVIAGFCVGRTL